MKIQNLVIIEFSETVNTCYIYDAQTYKDEKIHSVLLTSKSLEQATVTCFKKNIALAVIKHNPSMKKILDKYLVNYIKDTNGI